MWFKKYWWLLLLIAALVGVAYWWQMEQKKKQVADVKKTATFDDAIAATSPNTGFVSDGADVSDVA